MYPYLYLLSCLAGNKTSDDSLHSGETGTDSKDSVDSIDSHDSDSAAPDPVVGIVYDNNSPVTISIDPNDVQNGLPMAVGDINGDGVDDLFFVTPDFGVAGGKAYGFTKLSDLIAGQTVLAEDAEVQIEGGDRNGLYTLAIGSGTLYLGFAGLNGLDAWVSFNNPSTIDMADVFDPEVVPNGLDMTVINGPTTGGIGSNLIYVGDVEGQGFDSLIASGGSFCGIFNLSSLISGDIMDYSDVITHEVTQPYGGGSLCEQDQTNSGDLNGDGINDLFFGSDATLSGAYNIWDVLGGSASDYLIALPMVNASSSEFLAGSSTFEDGVEGVSYPWLADINGDGKVDLVLSGWEDFGAAHVIFGADYQAKVSDGTLSTGSNVKLDYTTGSLNLSNFPNTKSYVGANSGDQITYKSVAGWSDPSNPKIGLIAMGAANYPSGASVFVSSKARYDAVSGTTITVNAIDDQQLTGSPGGNFGKQVLFGDFDGDGVPDLVANDQINGEIKIFYGRAVHASEQGA